MYGWPTMPLLAWISGARYGLRRFLRVMAIVPLLERGILLDAYNLFHRSEDTAIVSAVSWAE